MDKHGHVSEKWVLEYIAIIISVKQCLSNNFFDLNNFNLSEIILLQNKKSIMWVVYEFHYVTDTNEKIKDV